MMRQYSYKRDSERTLEALDYAIRFIEDEYPKAYAKCKNGPEFEIDFTKSNVGYDVYRTGVVITKEEYESF